MSGAHGPGRRAGYTEKEINEILESNKKKVSRGCENIGDECSWCFTCIC